MTRTKGWLWMSGLQSPEATQYTLYQEITTVIDNNGSVEFFNRVDKSAINADEYSQYS